MKRKRLPGATMTLQKCPEGRPLQKNSKLGLLKRFKRNILTRKKLTGRNSLSIIVPSFSAD